jgi:hypothetical protein
VNWDRIFDAVLGMPDRLAEAYQKERTASDIARAPQHAEGLDRMTNLLVDMWSSLAAEYPSGHFDAKTPQVYFRDYLAGRHAWRSHLVRPGASDVLRDLKLKRAVLSDAEDAIEHIVAALFEDNDRGMFEVWVHRWRDAKQRSTI